MPVFFQHRFSEAQLLVWEAVEPETFFSDTLPEVVKSQLPGHPAKRKQFLASRYLLHSLEPVFPFEELVQSASGRPYLLNKPLQFSLSHADVYVAAITHLNRPVGIDVERVSERVLRVAPKFLSEEERGLLVSNPAGSDGAELQSMFTMAWSVKEAAFKALHQEGVDFIRDLPIVSVETDLTGWKFKLGGKGSGLEVRAMLFGSVSLAWALERESL